MTKKLLWFGLAAWGAGLLAWVQSGNPASTHQIASPGDRVDERRIGDLVTEFGGDVLAADSATALLLVNTECPACRAMVPTYPAIAAAALKAGLAFRFVISNDSLQAGSFALGIRRGRTIDPEGLLYHALDHWLVPTVILVDRGRVVAVRTLHDLWPPDSSFFDGEDREFKDPEGVRAQAWRGECIPQGVRAANTGMEPAA